MAVLAVAGTATTAASSPAAESSSVGIQASGTYNCGASYDYCVQQRAAYRHYGHQVSDIYYRQGQTCPGGGGCADGYYFHWWI